MPGLQVSARRKARAGRSKPELPEFTPHDGAPILCPFPPRRPTGEAVSPDQRILRAAEAVAVTAAERAGRLDRHGAFPVEDIAHLREAGLLAAPLPEALGGAGLCDPGRVDGLRAVLTTVGRGSLSLGRLYEGHVNALALVLRYGGEGCGELLREAAGGHLFAVWNTEPDPGGLVLDGERLHGAKSLASGAGYVTRALVTARLPDGERQMLVVPLEPSVRADIAGWRVQGMRASATGTLDFTGLPAAEAVRVGAPGDYGRQPFFFAGAWRFLAVQLGGIEAIVNAHRAHLRATGRGGDPHQRARLGRAAQLTEGARLFVAEAARIALREAGSPEAVIAYVFLARGAVERAGLDVIELAQRSVGLQGFMETHTLDRLTRDLATYLRQPGPDGALDTAAAHVLATGEPLHRIWPDPVA
jgi:alkylation response protein AidB-like acyl-CoA dehydrogenase